MVKAIEVRKGTLANNTLPTAETARDSRLARFTASRGRELSNEVVIST